MPKFKGSIIRGASPVNPDTIEVAERGVIFKKRRKYFIGYATMMIPYSKISAVEINTGFIGTDITIHSMGEESIIAHRFALHNAKEIKRLIESQL